jgi:sugar phosphate isomerase/epimerase
VSARPKFSVSQVTTFHSTFDQDLANYREAGVDGIGIWEFKLGEDRSKDVEAVAKLRDSGLQATTCIPGTLSVFPVPFPGPDDPAERVDALCAAVEMFAPFEPTIVLCLTGNPGEPGEQPSPGDRRTIVQGLRRAADVAGEHGIVLGLEPLHREVYGSWSIVTSIPQAVELMDEIDHPSIRLLYDVYHLWDTEDVLDHTREVAPRVAPSVHICDWRDPTRNDFDRVLPGDGIIDLPGIFGALEAGGWEGWVDLEIFSDDGSFTDQDFEDSLWKQDPVDVVRRGREGFERAWEARKTPA